MTTHKRRAGVFAAGGVAAMVAGVVGRYVRTTTSYADRDAAAVARAGFAERRTAVGGSTVNYAEGPDNGPALLLIHGQLTDWRNWSRVLPPLAARYHVFAVDCYGHGASARVPDRYTARAMAADAATFLDRVVGAPATVAGHSSGGLIAAGVAAHAPELVRGLVLEDPPFFSTLLPRATKTFNYVALATLTHEFLTAGEDDFTGYYLRHSVLWDLFGPLGGPIRSGAVRYHDRHPGEPVRICYLPPVLNELFRAMDDYDPRFGDAFYTGSFDEDFDHAETLARIACPVAQIHVKPRYDKNGILQAAMSDTEAERTRSLLRDVEFYRAGTGHDFHFEDPRRFDQIVRDLEKRVRD